MEILQEISTPDVPSFKVAQGHWNRHGSVGYSGDFLLIIHSNHQPISKSFRDKGDKLGALGPRPFGLGDEPASLEKCVLPCWILSQSSGIGLRTAVTLHYITLNFLQWPK